MMMAATAVPTATPTVTLWLCDEPFSNDEVSIGVEDVGTEADDVSEELGGILTEVDDEGLMEGDVKLTVVDVSDEAEGVSAAVNEVPGEPEEIADEEVEDVAVTVCVDVDVTTADVDGTTESTCSSLETVRTGPGTFQDGINSKDER